MSGVRWDTEVPLDDPCLAEAKVMHGKLRRDEQAFCEKDGPPLDPGREVALEIDHPNAGAMDRQVDCPACLAWIHA